VAFTEEKSMAKGAPPFMAAAKDEKGNAAMMGKKAGGNPFAAAKKGKKNKGKKKGKNPFGK
jgi:hypothetical protein